MKPTRKLLVATMIVVIGTMMLSSMPVVSPDAQDILSAPSSGPLAGAPLRVACNRRVCESQP